MARIFFWTWDEPGHVIPALALAKRLALRGHSIGFISGEGIAGMIEPHGFAVYRPPSTRMPVLKVPTARWPTLWR